MGPLGPFARVVSNHGLADADPKGQGLAEHHRGAKRHNAGGRSWQGLEPANTGTSWKLGRSVTAL